METDKEQEKIRDNEWLWTRKRKAKKQGKIRNNVRLWTRRDEEQEKIRRLKER